MVFSQCYALSFFFIYYIIFVFYIFVYFDIMGSFCIALWSVLWLFLNVHYK